MNALNNTTLNTRYLANTHVVENVSCELADYNMYAQDTALREAVQREGAAWADAELHQFGQRTGSADYLELGNLANKHQPELETHDRFGNRIDLVKFHPAYHQFMGTAIEHGLHSSPWTDPKDGAHVARAAGNYLHTQVEAGHGCPITMTFAAIPALRLQSDLAALWEPKITARVYDPRNVPVEQKQGVTIGMAMTEKQGGSDVQANSTRAYPVGQGGPGQAYELVGHKYFVSAPMCDAFLVLAHTDKGLSCFLLPRWRPDGSKNPMQVLRLKKKMGNASNASSETELRGALAWMVGEEGRGVRNIIEMVAMTRFDCMVGSSAGMRMALSQALHHCAHRSAFGARLNQQPLMQNVLADLALESEAAMTLSMRMARALDHRDRPPRRPAGAPGDRRGQILDLQAHARPRLRGHGMHRRQRRDGGQHVPAPVPRGAGQRHLGRQRQHPVPGRAARHGQDARGGGSLLRRTAPHAGPEPLARPACARPGQGICRHRRPAVPRPPCGRAHGAGAAGLAAGAQRPGFVADAFCASRLAPEGSFNYGALPRGVDVQAIIERATPRLQ
jgi:putative acyl-CoA dehydrogenase